MGSLRIHGSVPIFDFLSRKGAREDLKILSPRETFAPWREKKKRVFLRNGKNSRKMEDEQ